MNHQGQRGEPSRATGRRHDRARDVRRASTKPLTRRAVQIRHFAQFPFFCATVRLGARHDRSAPLGGRFGVGKAPSCGPRSGGRRERQCGRSRDGGRRPAPACKRGDARRRAAARRARMADRGPERRDGCGKRALYWIHPTPVNKVSWCRNRRGYTIALRFSRIEIALRTCRFRAWRGCFRAQEGRDLYDLERFMAVEGSVALLAGRR